MKVVALLTVRNEAAVLARCLQHLHDQGIETCLTDHGSEDATLAIAQAFRDKGIFRIEHLPFDGQFHLEDQLRHKEQLAAAIDADWFIHLDADEIRQAPLPYPTLRQAIAAVDAAGYNAIDFDEFVFVPTTDDESFEGHDYVSAMRWYYYFEPDSPDRHRINAWKKHPAIDLHTHAGHQVLFPGRRVYPRPFILRHYIMLSQAHARMKYGDRVFAPDERDRQWHSDRVPLAGSRLTWPDRSRLKRLGDAESFDKSEPWRRHFWLNDAHVSSEEKRPRPLVRQEKTFGPNSLSLLQEFKESQGDAIPTIPPLASYPQPFWSVMIPTFNPNPTHLRETLSGLLDQDPGEGTMQIEVVDDGSMTDVGAMVAKVGGGRIAFFRQSTNIGIVQNWNACLQRSRGKWVHILHQDDRVSPGFYQRLQSACESMPTLVAAFCRGSGIDEKGEIAWAQDLERETAGILPDFVNRLAAEQRILTPCIVVRRRSYEEIGGYHQGLPYCADWDMYKRLAVYGPMWYEPKSLAYWRQHDNSASARMRSAGADLADRRRSVELSKMYLPTQAEAVISRAALKGSLIWAIDTLRASLLADDFTTALAQNHEISVTLEQLVASIRDDIPITETFSGQPSTEIRQLWSTIDTLELQLRAWKLAANRLAEMAHYHGNDVEIRLI